ncbi:YciI family protein [Micromonospora sp. NPDC049175]|uniref:YciI family protein n=1 Tax=Micromonospora sp. NPDC049175 TaxID=3364266 RepID=UPI0037148F42
MASAEPAMIPRSFPVERRIRDESFVEETRGGRRGRRDMGVTRMTRYLISFNDGSMDHIPAEEIADVAKASHAVVREAMDAGVWVFGTGLERQQATIVATDGTVTDGPYPETREVIGGFAIVDVASRDDALAWAAKLAAACRCAQEVREIMPDPESEALLREADRRR